MTTVGYKTSRQPKLQPVLKTPGVSKLKTQSNLGRSAGLLGEVKLPITF